MKATQGTSQVGVRWSAGWGTLVLSTVALSTVSLLGGCSHGPKPTPDGPFCGGIAGFPCAGAGECIDDPSDDCDPRNGGADCGGICICPVEGVCVEGSVWDSSPDVCACVAEGQCGNTVCAEGMVCCNPSCGICTQPDGVCTQQACLPEE